MAQKALTFDDISLVPSMSYVSSRSALSTETKVGALSLQVPIFAANMTTVTGYDMVIKMHELGGAAILHRYQSVEDVLRQLKTAKETLGLELIPSIGIQESDIEAAKKYREFTSHICIDVAHGHHVGVLEMCKVLVDIGYKTRIAGNICTAKAARDLVIAGANVLKVGVGPGAACTTRQVTGCGVPQFTAIQNVDKERLKLEDAFETTIHIIADGGIKHSGDIVKAFVAGADSVMLGSLLAGTDESPSLPYTDEQGVKWKIYSGMASEQAQLEFRGKVSNDSPEGITTKVPHSGPVEGVIKQLVGGIRSGMSYLGADRISRLRDADYVEITPAGHFEGTPHGKSRH